MSLEHHILAAIRQLESRVQRIENSIAEIQESISFWGSPPPDVDPGPRPPAPPDSTVNLRKVK